uniref:Uncharacterized protein n=1 Tax=Panagrolaimus sp. ES5 TaxID=591445 RepID=A0AC34F7N9_9BILA
MNVLETVYKKLKKKYIKKVSLFKNFSHFCWMHLLWSNSGLVTSKTSEKLSTKRFQFGFNIFRSSIKKCFNLGTFFSGCKRHIKFNSLNLSNELF